MQIYVADLAAYNAGLLKGEWLDITGLDSDEVGAAISEILARTGGEEWAIHDHEDVPSHMVDEYMSIAELAALGQLSESVQDGAYPWEAVTWAMDRVSGGAWEISQEIENHMGGTYRDREDWACDFLESTGALEGLNSQLQYYFDFDKYARDCELSGDVSFIELDDGGVLVMHNH